jgi:hypothetical protein
MRRNDENPKIAPPGGTRQLAGKKSYDAQSARADGTRRGRRWLSQTPG